MSNIVTIPTAKSLQVYATLTKYGEDMVIEYSQVETFTYDTYESIEPEIPIAPPSSHSIEYYLLMFLLCLVPFLIFMAYIYGKRMGQKEKWFSKMSEVDDILDNLAVSQKSTKENSTASNAESDGPLENPLKTAPILAHTDSKLSFMPSNAESSPESVVDYKECIIGPTRDRKDSEVKSQSEGEKSQESAMSSPIFENQELVIIRNESNISGGINASIKYDIDPNNPNKKMEIQAPVVHKEQIKLHTDESQVNNYKVEFEVRTDSENGGLVKVETLKVTTVYNETSDIPEINAQRLKRDISQIPMSNDSKLLQIKADVSPEWSDSSSSTNKIVFLGSSQSKNEASGGVIAKKLGQNLSETEALQSTGVDNSKIVALLESEDLPDETGKFNKIFRNSELIGEGSFGAVYKVMHRLDSKIYAVKKVQLKLRRPEDLHKKNKIFREIFAMTDLVHPNIVRYATCWVEIENSQPKKIVRNHSRGVGDANRKNLLALKPADSMSNFSKKEESSMGFEFEAAAEGTRREVTLDEFEEDRSPSYRMEESMTKTLVEEDEDMTENSNTESYMPYPGDHDYLQEYKLFLYIQMEFCSGLSLRNYLDMQEKGPEPKKTLQMFKKLVEGVNAIHKKGILHRDLKPANIFLDSNEDVKIGDFGLASLGSNDQARGSHHIKSVDGDLERSFSRNVGSPMYSSPEQEIGNKYNQKTDIYSLGLILYEMLARFDTHHERYRYFKQIKSEHDVPANFRAGFPRESELIVKMTAHNPEMRPTAEDLITEINKILERSI